jgi:hypothetical protein
MPHASLYQDSWRNPLSTARRHSSEALASKISIYENPMKNQDKKNTRNLNLFQLVQCFLLVFIFVLFHYEVQGQSDIIYRKNGSIIRCKIREIKVNVITYKRTDVKRSPIYEINKDQTYKIRLKDGIVEIIDSSFYNSMRTNKLYTDTTLVINDTMNYAIIYIVFNSGYSDQSFPLYINGTFVYKLSNHSRLEYKIYSQGETEVCREVKNHVGPTIKFHVQHGRTYGISIYIKNEQKLDPNNRFLLRLYEEQESFNEFFENEYKNFKPFKDLDLKKEEK